MMQLFAPILREVEGLGELGTGNDMANIAQYR